MTQIAIEYTSKNYILRSGDTNDTDKTFELGRNQNNTLKNLK